MHFNLMVCVWWNVSVPVSCIFDTFCLFQDEYLQRIKYRKKSKSTMKSGITFTDCFTSSRSFYRLTFYVLNTSSVKESKFVQYVLLICVILFLITICWERFYEIIIIKSRIKIYKPRRNNEWIALLCFGRNFPC